MSKLGLVGIGCDFQSSFLNGPALAPNKIRTALYSDSANGFAELGCDVLSHPEFYDLGNWDDCQNQADYLDITARLIAVLDEGYIPLILGGDHAITYPVVKALMSKEQAVSILHFDAHPDLYDELQGNRYSHACPFARIMELGKVSRLVQVGIRTLNDHQRAQINKFGVECHEMKDFDRDSWRLDLDGPVYISIDIDALDPAYAPGVSHHEPGGLATRDILNIIQQIKQLPVTIVGADVVEYNPKRDLNDMTAMVAAKLVKELAGLILTQ